MQIQFASLANMIPAAPVVREQQQAQQPQVDLESQDTVVFGCSNC